MDVARWEQIKELFHTALELNAAERAAFLVTACGDDAELRREVELLLSANHQASGFLDSPALQQAAQSLADDKQSTQQFAPAIGQEFSHYKILSRIGAGGMGEVYLARDARLKRRVALKLLPLKFTQDAVRLQRFIREAEAASALNHPNIITIYEIGVAETERGLTHFISTEYIEGATLREWQPEEESKRLIQTLELGSQIASALDAAHQAGIVHRDIKPDNLMVRPDGLVKVLDFGLAKLTATNNSGSKQIDTDAETTPAEMQTLPGLILGTLRYMSPEQARGRLLDARTDIFSLGVVLHELLTGKPLFEGETTADVIAAIIHKEPPPLSTHLPDAPSELERILRKTLAKNCRDRYQTARDLQIDLQGLKQESELSARLARSGPLQMTNSGAVVVQTVTAKMRLRHLLWILPALVMLLGAFWWNLSRRGDAVELPPLSTLKNVQIAHWSSAPGEGNAQGTFSPDGKWIAFTSTQGGNKNVWIKQATAAGDAQPSSQDEFLNLNPIWSPTGEEIAFISNRGGSYGIWRKPPFGGTPTLIKTLLLTQLCAWSKNGSTLYYEARSNLFALEVNSGQTTQLTHFELGLTSPGSFSLSSDEQLIAYLTSTASGQTNLFVVPVGGGTPKQVASLLTEARGTVWHPDNQRIFFNALVNGTYQCFVADLNGHKPAQLTVGDRDNFLTNVSGDGSKLLLGSAVEESNIWGVEIEKGAESVVASDIDFEYWPSVSPDSQTIAYQTLKNFSQGHNSNSLIVLKALNSSDLPRVLIKEGYLTKWSPDGQRLAFMHSSGIKPSLLTIETVGGEERRLVEGKIWSVEASILPHTRDLANNYDWMPDSHHIIYSMETNGVSNLWMASTANSTNTPLTTQSDANLVTQNPYCSADGKRVAYLTRAKTAVESGKFKSGVWIATVATQEPKTLFQTENTVRLLGWSATEQELMLAVYKARTGIGQAEVELLSINAQTGARRSLAVLPSAYFSNIYLSPNKRLIAFTAHQAGKDDIWLIPVAGGKARKLTDNNNPDIYLSSLAWSPNNRMIYFGKQSQHGLFVMLTDFR